MAVTNSAPTTTRVTGMASGMDTDALVKALTYSQQAKIDKVTQTKQVAEWKKTAYVDFNEQIRSFKEEYSSVMGKNSLMSVGSFYSYTVSGETNAAAVSVKASAGAKSGSYAVDVKQLAKAASMESSKLSTSTTGLTTTQVDKTAVSKLNLNGGTFESTDGKIDFTLNGKEFSFDDTTTLKNIMDTVNKADVGVKMSYSQINDKLVIESTTKGKFDPTLVESPAPEKPAAFEMEAPDKTTMSEESYTAAKAIYDEAVADFNENVYKPYKAEYDSWSNASKVFASNQKKTVSFEDTDGFLGHLGMNSVAEGQSAIVSINGGADQTQDSNNFTLDGIAFTLNSVTSGTTAKFSVGSSSKDSVDKIKTFVDTFNGLISSLHAATSEKKNYSYKPLTDAQKEELTDDEITAWDAKAKAGIMKGDNNIDKLISSLRTAVTSSLGGGKLSDIGISIAKYEVGKAWKLEIDEEKLTAALESDADKVYNIFANIEETDTNKKGLMDRFNTAAEAFSSFTKTNNIQDLTNSISKYDKSIKELNSKMTIMSEKYYVQYAAMETSLAKMQSQQTQMAGMFGTSA